MRAISEAAATGPPSPPLRARVSRPSSRAVSSPATTLAELPLVLMPQARSPGRPRRAHLLGENLREIVVIGHRGEDRGVGGQGQGGQGRPLHLEPVDELRGQVLGVGGGPAVPENQHLAPGFKDLGQHLGRGQDLFAVQGKKTLFEADGFLDHPRQSRQWAHAASQVSLL